MTIIRRYRTAMLLTAGSLVLLILETAPRITFK